MEEQVAAALARRFEDHRIVFWDDSDGAWRERLDAIAPEGVTVARVANDEFAWKHRMLRAEREARFLVYRSTRPADEDNWLLDVELWAGRFAADRAAIWAGDLGLPPALEPVLAEHAELLRSAKRVEALKARLDGSESDHQLRLKMLATATEADGSGLEAVLEALLAERAAGRDEAARLIARAGLADVLWREVERAHGYRSDQPGIGDYAVALFRASWRRALGEAADLNMEAQLFFARWRDSRRWAAAFEPLSADAARALGIADAARRAPLDRLAGAFEFEEVDRQVIRLAAEGVAGRTLSPGEVTELIRRRAQHSHWWPSYRDLYEAIGFAAAFTDTLASARLEMTGMEDGVRRYAESWHRIDALYRRFTHAAQRAGQVGLTGPLSDAIERAYVDGFLLKLGDRWQAQVDRAERWEAGAILSQRSFAATVVGDYRQRGLRLVVIVSDALRYEVAAELAETIRRVDRFEATMEPMLSSLPSYTQLGMAALLPHGTLEIRDDDTGLVLADGRATGGLENRRQILAGGRVGERATALKSDAFMDMDRDTARALIRDHDLVYLYHNRIDAIGDKPPTETQTFEACTDTIVDLERLVKKLAGANATHMVVTADHGFLYQHRPVGEGEYLSEAPSGAEILYRDRRFVLGRGLSETHGRKRFTAAQLGLSGDVEALIPKSINRLRRQGSGSRFVHGGATLQEVVVPVLRVNKGRRSDVEQVEVEVIGLPPVVTTNQFSVRLYQAAPVTEKAQPRTLRLSVRSDADELLSDEHEIAFARTDADVRARETSVRFLLSRASDAHDGQEVVLRLDEPHGDTSHWRPYREARFRIRRAMGNDFDF